jgi:hypothetical protein
MCTGMIAPLLISSAMTAGGTFINQRAEQANAERQMNARNQALQATLAQNKIQGDRARTAYQQREDAIQPQAASQQSEDLTQKRQQTFQQALAPVQTGEIPIAGSAPSVIGKAMSEAFNREKDFNSRKADARGALEGYSDVFLQRGLGDQQARRDIGVANNFIQGNMGILPAQQQVAALNATKPNPFLGNLLIGGGNMLSMAGGSGMGGGKAYSSPYKKA